MNAQQVYTFNNQRMKTGQKRSNGPSYDFNELAVHLGILSGQLRNVIRNAPTPPPKPCLTMGKREWYCLRDFKAWYDSLPVKDFAVSTHAKPKSVLTH